MFPTALVEFTPFVLEDNKPSVEMIRSLFLLIPLSLALWAAEPAVTLENHIPPEANTATESLRSELYYQFKFQQVWEYDSSDT